MINGTRMHPDTLVATQQLRGGVMDALNNIT